MPRKPTHLVALALAASVGLPASGCATPAADPPQTSAPRTTALETPVAPATESVDPETVSPDGAESASAAADNPGVRIQPATSALVEASPRPVSLDIPGTDITVKVIDVGVESDNEMEIPESFYEAGWYRYGPAPGAAAGNAVLAAHIDIGTEVMPFTQLKDVPPGTVITVGRENAEPVQYEVTDVRHEPKATLDTAEIFHRDGEHQLMIITCGGGWLADEDDYEDNVVLTASPL
ncbi:sortase [Arthrobacter sp. H20]|uniref:sortase domain-containing protein n=1 Tax=Arthrobacter sp. H20 TaxID=1267981 RepID=UPI00047C6337|nr:sortase [Arthrobacter sp. H20]